MKAMRWEFIPDSALNCISALTHCERSGMKSFFHPLCPVKEKISPPFLKNRLGLIGGSFYSLNAKKATTIESDIIPP